MDIFESVSSTLNAKILEFCQQHFSRFQSSGLYHEVTYIILYVSKLTVSTTVADIFGIIVKTARKDIHLCCWKELHRPFTMEKEEYIKLKERKRNELLRSRHPKAVDEVLRPTFNLSDFNSVSRSFPATNQNLSKVLASYGIYVSSPTELICLSTDKYHAELDVMAHVAAYFVISSRRFIDDIPRVFETVFASNFGERLTKNLVKDLNLVGETGVVNCQRFVRDEPHIEEKRDRLIRTLGILDKAKETIDRFFK